MPRSSEWCHFFKLLHQHSYAFLFSPIRSTCPTHLIFLSYHPDGTCWEVQIIKLHTMQFFASLLLLRTS
jgi:hypothetical protein